jgi:hypothetical protein
MSAAIGKVAPRLVKLIPLLASDHDGEVVATVTAIRRTLAAVGLDLHDLAEVISAPGYVPSVERATGHDFESMFATIWLYNPPGPEWRDMLESIRDQYRTDGRLSSKQANLVRRFHETALRNAGDRCAA